MLIEKTSPVPIHLQLRKIILSMIESGKLKPGDKLYSESEFCKLFDISRMTVRRVINDLANEGYIQRVAGKGSFVCEPKIIEKLTYVSTFAEDMHSRGLKPNRKLLERKIEEPNTKVTEMLNLVQNDNVICIKMLLYANEEPICLQEVFLPFPLFKNFMLLSIEEVEQKDLCEILNTYITRPVLWAKQTLEAVLLKSKDARLLEVSTNVPGLLCERVTFDELDTPIEYVTFLYRADRYKFMIDKRNVIR
ncbi:MAG: GntR family transcriptional regulator [Candidatus Atribacteria bacterium]|nr:GntR family transcriptional regulator [Candidatus Atribacteria bacterium]